MQTHIAKIMEVKEVRLQYAIAFSFIAGKPLVVGYRLFSSDKKDV